MTGYSDDAKVLELLAPLRRLAPLPFAVPERGTRRLRRPVLAAAVILLALGLAGAAIADGLGAFDGIAAAQHPQTGADVIDPATEAYMEGRDCPGVCMAIVGGILWDTARAVGQLPSGQNVYVFTTRSNSLCYVVGPPHPEWDCEDPLTRAHPSTVFVYTAGGKPWTIVGIALDGVTSVSFDRDGQEVTVPVKDNVWIERTDYSDASNAMTALTAHFADGTTVVQRYP